MSVVELTPEVRRIARLSPADAHREGLPIVLVLQAKIAEAVEAQQVGSAPHLWREREMTLREDLELVLLTHQGGPR